MDYFPDNSSLDLQKYLTLPQYDNNSYSYGCNNSTEYDSKSSNTSTHTKIDSTTKLVNYR